MGYSVPLHQRITLRPGDHRATTDATVLSTLLGSCVAACLYDANSGVAGLNHFLLASPRYSRTMPLTHTDAGRYGIMAMELLINDMVHLGAERKRLKAKVFGGASVIKKETGIHDNFLCVNEVNQRFIREYLKTENIPIVAEDLGGQIGRVVYFHTDTFKVMRRYIQSSSLVQIEEKEHRYWKKHIEKPEEGEITLFD